MTQFKVEIKPDISQRLQFTPYMQLSLLVMQLNRQSLEEYVVDAVNNNPLLEIEYSDHSYSQYNIDDNFIESLADDSYNLYDLLLEQAKSIHTTQYPLLEYCIYLIDENGYLKEDLDLIAEEQGTDLETVEKVVGLIQQFEPVGVGSRDLQECLEIQAVKYYPENKLLKELIRSHLYDIAENNIDFIVEKTGFEKRTVIDSIALLQTLNPKPGNGFEKAKTDFVIPEFEILLEEDNHFVIKMFKDFTVKVNRTYEAQYQYLSKEDKAKILQLTSDATQLIHSIERREGSLNQIMSNILEIQRDYFINQSPLVKLRLRDLAKKTELHISTISRIIKDKYYLFEGNIYPINSLLCKGKEYSVEQIKYQLKEILLKENYSYNDRQLTEELRKRGYIVSRRVIAKYRNQLGYQSSYRRKEEKYENKR